MSAPLLEVRDLRVQFPTSGGPLEAVDGLDLAVERGRTLGVVGESGSGKSVMAHALLGLHGVHGGPGSTSARVGGEVRIDGVDILAASTEQVRAMRGDVVALVPQDPLAALHPYLTVGDQVTEAYRVHRRGVSRRAARDRAVDMLGRVGIPQPARRFDDHPHQLSGGMRQRVLIAMALICEPALLVADEPTTALDVTVQASILDLLADLQAELGMAVVLVTHDLGVVAEAADEVLVMYAGQAVERGSVVDVLGRPEMPYTWGLLGSAPRLDRDRVERLVPIPGAPPSLVAPGPGCLFAPRCTHQAHVDGGPERCAEERPVLTSAAGRADHVARCHIDAPVRGRLWREPGGAR